MERIYCPTIGLLYLRDDLNEMGMNEEAEKLQLFIDKFNELLKSNESLRNKINYMKESIIELSKDVEDL